MKNLNKLFILTFFLLISLIKGFGSLPPPSYCAREYSQILETIQQLPKANDLISRVLENGPISIEPNSHMSKRFEGYWDGESRTIYLTECRTTTEGSLLTTLLFELHNALRTSDLEQLDSLAMNHQISKKNYIRSVEYIEYMNARSTSSLLYEGIEFGIFPESSAWAVDNNFEDHFQYQRSCGHSGWIGNNYDQLT